MKSTYISICLLYHDLTLLSCTPNVTMLFAIVICHLIAASVSNPFHKYPFVFLLDVGNEELDKTNTEQIRVSIPGGSLAVRYPAVADGDLITHVRVSGIDFGTDLKANIIDGGPGYKYVVLVFSGNTGVPYDAIVTLQTVPSDKDPDNSYQSRSSSASDSDTSITSQNSDEGEENDSAEEMDNNGENTVANIAIKENSIEPSSNVYKYAQMSRNDGENDESSSGNSDRHLDDDDNETLNREKKFNHESVENEINVENDADNNDNNNNQYQAQRLQAQSNEDNSYNNKYNEIALKEEANKDETLDADARMYEQDSIYDTQGHDAYSGEDAVEIDQMFNDEEIHNDADKYKDSNNNNYDSDYDSAVAY